MKRTILIVKLAAVLLLALAFAAMGISCTTDTVYDNEARNTPAPDTATESAASSAPKSIAASACEAYRLITARAESYDFGADPEMTVIGYRYALVDMQKGDEAPTLLLAQMTAFGIEYVRVFRYDSETDSVIVALLPEGEGPIMQGAGSAGGFRGELSLFEDGSGLCLIRFSSFDGEGSVSRITAEGNELAATELWKGTDPDSAPYSLVPIEAWYDAADDSGLCR